MELRTTADTVLRRRLLSVPGVSQVTPIGGGEKQYQVVLSPAETPDLWGHLETGDRSPCRLKRQCLCGLSGRQRGGIPGHRPWRIRTLEDVGDTVVAAENGVPIRVSDLGSVRIDTAPQRGEVRQHQPAVILGIQKQPGANTLTLTRALEAVLTDLQATLPAGMQITGSCGRRLY